MTARCALECWQELGLSSSLTLGVLITIFNVHL